MDSVLRILWVWIQIEDARLQWRQQPVCWWFNGDWSLREEWLPRCLLKMVHALPNCKNVKLYFMIFHIPELHWYCIRKLQKLCCSVLCSTEWRKTFFLYKLKPYPTASWTSWTEWTQCSASCGSGSRLRMRSCSGDNSLCVGDLTETEACETTDCPGAF